MLSHLFAAVGSCLICCVCAVVAVGVRAFFTQIAAVVFWFLFFFPADAGEW